MTKRVRSLAEEHVRVVRTMCVWRERTIFSLTSRDGTFTPFLRDSRWGTQEDKLLPPRRRRSLVSICFLPMSICLYVHSYLGRRLPGPGDHFAHSSHGLRVGRHSADGSDVVHDVLRRNSLPPGKNIQRYTVNARLSEESYGAIQLGSSATISVRVLR